MSSWFAGVLGQLGQGSTAARFGKGASIGGGVGALAGGIGAVPGALIGGGVYALAGAVSDYEAALAARRAALSSLPGNTLPLPDAIQETVIPPSK